MTNEIRVKPAMPYSLDQLQVFLAVHDAGGFAAAARQLNRAQSAVTYAIRQLEEDTGLVLFDRAHYRPQLTDAGRTLLPRARRIVMELTEFHQQAKDFAKGVEAELCVVVNEFADLSMVVAALQRLHSAYPSVRVQLIQQPFGDDLDMIRQGTAQLGILPEVRPLGHAFVSNWIGRQQLVAVVAPQHPLATKSQPMDIDEVQGHLQIVWSRAGKQSSQQVLPLSQQQDLGIHSLDTWRVTELATKRQFILAGLGWGSLPMHLVRDDIAQGRLVEIQLTSWEGRDRMPSFDVCVCRLKQLRLGPAARFLVETLSAAVE